jgi:hypothetical protein
MEEGVEIQAVTLTTPATHSTMYRQSSYTLGHYIKNKKIPKHTKR